jgi:hypothetical protein
VKILEVDHGMKNEGHDLEHGIGDVLAKGTRHIVSLCCGSKAQEMLLLWKQGTGDVVAVGTRHRRCCCCGNKAQEMLLLWEQGTWYVIAVGARHMRCCCGNPVQSWFAVGARPRKCCCCGNKVYEMLLLREQGIRNAMALEIWPVGTRYCRRCVAVGTTNKAKEILLLWE